MESEGNRKIQWRNLHPLMPERKNKHFAEKLNAAKNEVDLQVWVILRESGFALLERAVKSTCVSMHHIECRYRGFVIHEILNSFSPVFVSKSKL